MAKKKVGERYPGGKLKPQEWLPFRREFLRVNRVHDGRRWHTALKDEGATALDRLLFRKLIDGEEHAAGEEYCSLWVKWVRRDALSPWPFPRVASLERFQGHGNGLSPDPRARRAFEAAENSVMQEKDGFAMMAVIARVSIFDLDPPQSKLFFLRRGLRILAGYFGFTR